MNDTRETSFPEAGILWRRGWNDATMREIDASRRPFLLFVGDADGSIYPFLREIFAAMPRNPQLRALLHDKFIGLYSDVDALPEELRALGIGTRRHIAIISGRALIPIVYFDAVTGDPARLVSEIAQVLQRLLDGEQPGSARPLQA